MVGNRAVTVPLIPFPVQFGLVFQQKPRFRFCSVLAENRGFGFGLKTVNSPWFVTFNWQDSYLSKMTCKLGKSCPSVWYVIKGHQ